MKLKRIGFFSELSSVSTESTTLAQAVQTATADEAEKLAAYLRSGVVFVASPGVERDVLDEQHPIVGSGHVMTDGTWMWPDVLAHYVATYRVRLRDEFIEHARALGWKVPSGIDARTLSV